jgi:hypothetical protein
MCIYFIVFYSKKRASDGSHLYSQLGIGNVSVMNKQRILSQTPTDIMAQLIDPVPSNESNFVFCCYVNATSKMQVARITNVPNWYFERVVFPGQRLLFEALPEGNLEIHTGMMASAILSDTIPCAQLRLPEDDLVETPYAPAVEQQIETRNEGLPPSEPLAFQSTEPLALHGVVARAS